MLISEFYRTQKLRFNDRHTRIICD